MFLDISNSPALDPLLFRENNHGQYGFRRDDEGGGKICGDAAPERDFIENVSVFLTREK